MYFLYLFFFFSSRRRHTRFSRDWSSDVCSSDLPDAEPADVRAASVEHEDALVVHPERIGERRVAPQLDAVGAQPPLEAAVELERAEPVDEDAAGDAAAAREDRPPDALRGIALAHPHELGDVDGLARAADLRVERVEDGAVIHELELVPLPDRDADLALEQHVERHLVRESQHPPRELRAPDPAGEVPAERPQHD